MAVDAIHFHDFFKDVEKADMIGMLFDVSDTAAHAYIQLLDGPAHVHEIAVKLDRDRTTAQRAVKSLVKKGLVQRKRITHKNGGMKYVYEALPLAHTRTKMLEALDHWSAHMKNKISEF